MVLQAHILGTSSARPTLERDVSGMVLSSPEGLVVIDPGEGFQRRYATYRKQHKLNKTGESIRPSAITALCFSHGHLDHTWGALPWLQSLSLENRSTPLTVYGPTSSEVIDSLLNTGTIPDEASSSDLARQFSMWFDLGANSHYLSFPIQWILIDVIHQRWLEINPLNREVKLLETLPQPTMFKSTLLKPYATQHSVPSCAWELSFQSQKTSFNADKAILMGLSAHQQQQLATGRDITLDDGITLQASSFQTSPPQRLSILVSGDTAEQSISSEHMQPPTLLLHEATFSEQNVNLAHHHLHSTAAGAARTANAIEAQTLGLLHFSNRIKHLEEIKSEVIEVWGHRPCFFLNDDEWLTITKDGKVQHHRF